MPYLLALSLGPVQEFIAAARKTRDLWFGSHWLSETARHAALALQGEGADLIFPAPAILSAHQQGAAPVPRSGGADGAAAPVPNKIMAIVDHDHDPAVLAGEARRAAQSYLRAQRDEALGALRRAGATRSVDLELLDAQLGGFLEFYAAWWPFDGRNYQAARVGAEALLAGRKALRDFVPAAGRDGVPKSMLDGGREAVIRTDRESEDILRRLDMKGAELLDGVSLIKRLAPRRQFVSVSRLAADPLMRRLARDARTASGLAELREIADGLALQPSPLVQRLPADAQGLAHYRDFPFDTELFYDDGVADEGLPEEERAQVQRFYHRLRAMCRVLGVGAVPAYLAVLVADGDRIGRTIGTMTTPQAHIAFSRAGVAFAKQAGDVVAAHQGALVYSGGDDVLALVPLDMALPCAGALRQAFVDAMAALDLGQDAPTLSVGIAVGHYNEQLQNLLDWARAAERVAKRTRNALAVALHTRSAGAAAVTVARRWDDEPLARWARWIDWYRRDIVPDGAAYELRALARELRALAGAGLTAGLTPLASGEVERILRRKQGGRGTRSLSEGEVGDIVGLLRPEPVAGAADRPEVRVRAPGEAPSVVDRLEVVVNEMIVARHVARVMDAAEGPLNGDRGLTHER